MMSAVTSAENGNEVILLEKMEKLGKKLLITGKGRCNITNSAEMTEFMKKTPGVRYKMLAARATSPVCVSFKFTPMSAIYDETKAQSM